MQPVCRALVRFRSFFEVIRVEMPAYGQICGQRLVPYMSAVKREDWSRNASDLQDWLLESLHGATRPSCGPASKRHD